MPNPNDTPLIYTRLGNLPIDSLTRVDGWDFDNQGISYWEEYRLGDGEIVRRSVARFQFPEGTSLNLSQGVLNG